MFLAVGYAAISNGFCLPSFPRKCHLMTSSETGSIFLLRHSAHFMPRSRPQTPRTHWFSQQGEYPFLPVLALSKRRANTSPRPQNSERNSFTFSSFDELLLTPLMGFFGDTPLTNPIFATRLPLIGRSRRDRCSAFGERALPALSHLPAIALHPRLILHPKKHNPDRGIP